ncbi:MAG: hypothetical protein AAF587_09480 [Bacteroidota bacterium]
MMRLPVYLCSFFMVFAMFSCQTEEEVAPSMELVSSCSLVGTVMNGDCGLYLAVSNGQKIYVDSPKKFSLQEGNKVKIGYYRSSTTSLDQGVCTNCGSEDNSGDEMVAEDPTANMSEKEACMYLEGISLAVLTCIEPHSDNSSD